LDVLLMDLPPGTGDIAISVAQLVPTAELLVVTTPQQAAAEVAERAGAIALQTHQQLVGVVENMSWLELPDGSRMEVFGAGGGSAVAAALSRSASGTAPRARTRCVAGCPAVGWPYGRRRTPQPVRLPESRAWRRQVASGSNGGRSPSLSGTVGLCGCGLTPSGSLKASAS